MNQSGSRRAFRERPFPLRSAKPKIMLSCLSTQIFERRVRKGIAVCVPMGPANTHMCTGTNQPTIRAFCANTIKTGGRANTPAGRYSTRPTDYENGEKAPPLRIRYSHTQCGQQNGRFLMAEIRFGFIGRTGFVG